MQHRLHAKYILTNYVIELLQSQYTSSSTKSSLSTSSHASNKPSQSIEHQSFKARLWVRQTNPLDRIIFRPDGTDLGGSENDFSPQGKHFSPQGNHCPTQRQGFPALSPRLPDLGNDFLPQGNHFLGERNSFLGEGNDFFPQGNHFPTQGPLLPDLGNDFLPQRNIFLPQGTSGYGVHFFGRLQGSKKQRYARLLPHEIARELPFSGLVCGISGAFLLRFLRFTSFGCSFSCSALLNGSGRHSDPCYKRGC